MLKILNREEEFKNLTKEGRWLVDFNATWCGPCRMLEPVLEEISKQYNVLKVDVDQFPNLAASFGVMSIPTLIVFENAEQKKISVGYKPYEEIENMLKND